MNSEKGSRRVFHALGVVVSIGLVVMALVGSGETNKAEQVGGSNANSGKSSGEAQSFGVGDTVKLGDWTVTVVGVTDPQSPVNKFSRPSAGNRWVTVDAQVENLSAEPSTVSSLMCFDLQDADNRSYDVDVMSGVTPGPPDGEVAGNGGKLRGNLVFEVPEAASGLSLVFKCDLFSKGSATIKLS